MPAVVVDVGNSRIKWGFCSPAGICASCSLPPDDPASWSRQIESWKLPAACCWALSSVHPARCQRLAGWLQQQGHTVAVLDDPACLPLRVLLERPDHVGMDRLFDAVAANSQRAPGRPAAIIDAGSAVTVDWLDADGAFVGGVILPGLRLMAKALHDYTALLPLVDPPTTPPPIPAVSTPAAVEAGIFWAVVGGVERLLADYARQAAAAPHVFLTGGDAAVLHAALPLAALWPTMTLEGIRLSADTLP
jgi:type III pantothenate kinase